MFPVVADGCPNRLPPVVAPNVLGLFWFAGCPNMLPPVLVFALFWPKAAVFVFVEPNSEGVLAAWVGCWLVLDAPKILEPPPVVFPKIDMVYSSHENGHCDCDI